MKKIVRKKKVVRKMEAPGIARVKRPLPSVPPPFRPLVYWLRDRRGINLLERNRHDEIYIGNVKITPQIAKSLVELVQKSDVKDPDPEEELTQEKEIPETKNLIPESERL